jgi:hypothetical protein
MDERHSGIQASSAAIDSAGRGPSPPEAPADVHLTIGPMSATASCKPSPRKAPAQVVAAFLPHTLSGGAVPVAEIEEKARAAELTGERQTITNSKKFKAAKAALQIRSYRVGFGRGAVWFWALPTPSSSPMAESLDHPPRDTPVSVIYDDDRFQPDKGASIEAAHYDFQSGPAEDARCRLPLDWVRGVACLRRQTRPSGIPVHRWKLFVADSVRFMDPQYPWARRAAEVGWTTGSLFGSRYQRPIDHIGSSGLLWDLAGGTIMQVSRDTVTIVSENGKHRIFHRRPAWMTTMLPWDWS